MSNLFGIAQKYDYLVSQIEENDGEITEEIAEELAIAESELEDKLRAYRQVIDAQKANIAYNKDEIKRLRDRNVSFDKIAGRLKSSVVDALHIFGQVGNLVIIVLNFLILLFIQKSQKVFQLMKML
jgi:hypothetical protein